MLVHRSSPNHSCKPTVKKQMLYRFIFMTETTLLIALPVLFRKIILCENYTAFKILVFF